MDPPRISRTDKFSQGWGLINWVANWKYNSLQLSGKAWRFGNLGVPKKLEMVHISFYLWSTFFLPQVFTSMLHGCTPIWLFYLSHPQPVNFPPKLAKVLPSLPSAIPHPPLTYR